jgi:hypothetical protein
MTIQKQKPNRGGGKNKCRKVKVSDLKNKKAKKINKLKDTRTTSKIANKTKPKIIDRNNNTNKILSEATAKMEAVKDSSKQIVIKVLGKSLCSINQRNLI